MVTPSYDISRPLQMELRFLADQSNHPFLSDWMKDAGLDDKTREKLIENPALQLRLKLWWGWPDAPFPCMEVMIRKHLEYLEREGYVRKINGEYELSEEGVEKLERTKDQKVPGLGGTIRDIWNKLDAKDITEKATIAILLAVGERFLMKV